MKLSITLGVVALVFGVCHVGLPAPDDIHFNRGIFHTHGTGTDHTGYKYKAHTDMKYGRGQQHTHRSSDSKKPHGNDLHDSTKGHTHLDTPGDKWHSNHDGKHTFETYVRGELRTYYSRHSHDTYRHIHDVDQHEFRHWHRLLDGYEHFVNEDDDIEVRQIPCSDECLAGCDEDMNCLPDPCADCLSECIDDGTVRECPDPTDPVDPCKECPTTCVDGKCPDLEEGCKGEMCDDETPPVRRRYSTPSSDVFELQVSLIEDCTELVDAYNEYSVSLSQGTVKLAIPHGAIGINGCDIEFENISDFVDVLPNHINYVYGVGIDRFSYGNNMPDDDFLDSYPNEDKELYDGFGFLANLSQVLMFMWSVEPMKVSADLTIMEGYRAYGVPIQSDDLATLGDFFGLFSGIFYVYIYDDKGNGIPVYRSSETYHDIPIEGWRAYLIRSASEQTVTLEGETWRDPIAAAPAIMREGKLSTTWGAIKKGKQ